MRGVRNGRAWAPVDAVESSPSARVSGDPGSYRSPTRGNSRRLRALLSCSSYEKSCSESREHRDGAPHPASAPEEMSGAFHLIKHCDDRFAGANPVAPIDRNSQAFPLLQDNDHLGPQADHTHSLAQRHFLTFTHQDSNLTDEPRGDLHDGNLISIILDDGRGSFIFEDHSRVAERAK